jgi:HEAT repeat protein
MAIQAGAEPTSASESKYTLAAEVCLHLSKLLASYRTYGPDHTNCEAFLERLWQRLSALLTKHEELPLHLSMAGIMVEDKTVYTPDNPASSIVQPLVLDGVQRVVIARGIPREELVSFVRLWHDAFGQAAGAEHTFVNSVWMANFPHIRVVAVETFSEAPIFDGEKERKTDIASLINALGGQSTMPRSRTAGRPAYMRLTKEDLQLIQNDVLTSVTPEELERQDLAKRPPVAALQAGDMTQLAREINTDLQSATDRSLRALDHAVAQAQSGDVLEASEIVARMASGFVDVGKPEHLPAALTQLRQIVGRARQELTHPNVRANFRERIGRAFESEATLTAIARCLDNPSGADGAELALRLLRPQSVPLLLDALRQVRSSPGRKRLATVIAAMKPSGQDVAMRVKTFEAPIARDLALVMDGLPEADAALVRRSALAHKDAQFRKLFIESLSLEHVAQFRRELYPLLQDPDAGARAAALVALVKAGDPNVVPLIAQVLARDDLDATERQRMIAALSAIGGDAACGALRKEFETRKDDAIKAACAMALAKAGDEAARPLLTAAAKKFFAGKVLKEACAEALRVLDARAHKGGA